MIGGCVTLPDGTMTLLAEPSVPEALTRRGMSEVTWKRLSHAEKVTAVHRAFDLDAADVRAGRSLGADPLVESYERTAQNYREAQRNYDAASRAAEDASRSYAETASTYRLITLLLIGAGIYEATR